jgi:hypothetical protein
VPTIDDVRKCLAGNTAKDPRQRVNEVIALCEEQPVTTKVDDTPDPEPETVTRTPTGRRRSKAS